MPAPLLPFPRAPGRQQAESEQPEHGPRLLHQARNPEQHAAAKEQNRLSGILPPQQQQQSGQGRHNDEMCRMRRQPQHDRTGREQRIRGGGCDGSGHIQKMPGQPVEQPGARHIDQQQPEVDSRGGLAKQKHQPGVGRINPRELHVVKELVGRNALEHQLAAVGEFPFIPFQRDCQQPKPDHDNKKNGQEQ